MYQYLSLNFSRARKQPRLLFTTRLIFIYGGQSIKTFSCIFYTLCTNRIMHPLALFTPIDNSTVKKYFHMMGKGWLCDIHFLQQLTSTFLSIG